MKAIPKSNFGDGSDTYDGIWVWSVTDEITEYSAAQARGVISSLVKKDLIYIVDNEGNGKAKDMWLAGTEAGNKIINNLKPKS